MNDLPKVFVSEPIDPKGIALLKNKVELMYAPDTTKTTVMTMIGEADAAILRATTIFDSEVITKGSKLKMIVRTGVGMDNVDMKAAGEQGIWVCNTPNTNDETVAEHTLAIVLALAKQIIPMDRAVRNQKWHERFSPKQMDISAKTIGIIGYGKIGKATARKCKAMGMKVMIYDPYIDMAEDHITMAKDVKDIFKESDFVSLHCPSGPDNHNLVNNKHLSLMKPGAFLVNTSRGSLIDEEALIAHLQSGKIAGAGLDVFKEEPLPIGHPFLSMSNVILSPHVAGSTKESNERIAIAAAQAVIDVISCKTPQHICNSKFFIKKPTEA
jgi:D-3-phosphoglycerate dehydrogenase